MKLKNFLPFLWNLSRVFQPHLPKRREYREYIATAHSPFVSIWSTKVRWCPSWMTSTFWKSAKQHQNEIKDHQNQRLHNLRIPKNHSHVSSTSARCISDFPQTIPMRYVWRCWRRLRLRNLSNAFLHWPQPYESYFRHDGLWLVSSRWPAMKTNQKMKPLFWGQSAPAVKGITKKLFMRQDQGNCQLKLQKISGLGYQKFWKFPFQDKATTRMSGKIHYFVSTILDQTDTYHLLKIVKIFSGNLKIKSSGRSWKK